MVSHRALSSGVMAIFETASRQRDHSFGVVGLQPKIFLAIFSLHFSDVEDFHLHDFVVMLQAVRTTNARVRFF
jgi:hypothetical protein